MCLPLSLFSDGFSFAIQMASALPRLSLFYILSFYSLLNTLFYFLYMKNCPKVEWRSAWLCTIL